MLVYCTWIVLLVALFRLCARIGVLVMAVACFLRGADCQILDAALDSR